MGDLPTAGRYWYPLDLGDNNPDVRRAIDAFEARCGRHEDTIKAHLRFIRRLDLDLDETGRAERRREQEHRTVTRLPPSEEVLRNYREIRDPGDMFRAALVVLTLALLVLALIVGIVTIIGWFF